MEICYGDTDTIERVHFDTAHVKERLAITLEYNQLVLGHGDCALEMCHG
jgi:hypothetical protein